jgi:hypothetical protein
MKDRDILVRCVSRKTTSAESKNIYRWCESLLSRVRIPFSEGILPMAFSGKGPGMHAMFYT